MAGKDLTVWGIHAGKTGDADPLFLKKNVVAIGWDQMGDLCALSADREAFKARLTDAYPEKKAGAIPVDAGQLFRFVHELKPGDLVVYPSKADRLIHVCVVEGDYKYDPGLDKNYPNMRPVRWSTKPLPRTAFTQGALYEIGSAMSFFQVKTYADEFIAAFEGKAQPVEPEAEDETVAYVVSEIEQNTKDYIVKRLSQQLKGHPFAHFIAHLLQRMGYRTRVSPEGPDGGIDVIAHKDEMGFEPPIVKVQVKSNDGSIGDPAVSALYGKIGSGEFGLFIILGTFTKQAVNFAASKSNLRLIDGDQLVDLILEHYEQFDSKYKGLLPLKQVYIPESLEDAD